MDKNQPISVVRPARKAWRVAGGTLFAVIVASWFACGPLGIVFYLGGLFSFMWVFLAAYLLPPMCGLAVIGMLLLGIPTIRRWRQLTDRTKLVQTPLVIACAAFVGSFAVGFSGAIPAPYDMYVRGFSRHVGSRMDVKAIQHWLGTLDPNEYTDKYGSTMDRPLARSEQPACIASLHPKMATVKPGDKGRLSVRLLWGGGFLGHWGVEVGDAGMERISDEHYGYRQLAAGTYAWCELE